MCQTQILFCQKRCKSLAVTTIAQVRKEEIHQIVIMSKRAFSDIDTSISSNSPRKRRRIEKEEKEEEESPLPTTTNSVENEQDENQDPSTTNNEANDQSIEETDLSKMTKKELKELCKQKSLKVGGNKQELIRRLRNPDSASSKKSTKGSKRNSVKKVHDMLRNAGVDDPESVNPCLKRGIQRGYYQIDGPQSLDKVILKGGCSCCSEQIDVTIRMSLYQSTIGNDYEDGGEGGAVQCEDEECGGQYITRLCEGKPELDSGKFHNHCTECPGFGKCIYDYRNAHCDECNKHYFCGLSGFGCDNCARKQGRDFDDLYDGFW